MTPVASTLAPVCPQLERELKPHLSGFFSGIVRSYLPQAWNFTTEQGSATLWVDTNGSASVVDGAVRDLDVSIRWGQAQLDWAIGSQGKGPRPPGPDPQFTFHTEKGRTAFGFLRRRLNL